MRVNNYDYDDLVLRYSRTAQVLKSGKFDNVLTEAAKMYSQRTPTGRDEILTFTARKISGPDTLLIEAARAYSQAKNVSGCYDSVLRGAIS